LIISDVAEAFGGNLPFVVLPYFTRVVLGDACMKPSTMFTILAGVNILSRMLIMPVWVWAGRHFGKFKTFLYYNFLLALSHCLFIVIGKDTESCFQLKFAIVGAALWGAVYGGSFFLKSIMSDVVDYDEFLSGKRREGLYMMTLEFLPKFLEVPAEALPFLLMAYLGYRRPNEDGTDPGQPIAVSWLLRLCFSVVPAAFIGAAAVVLCRFPGEARCGRAHQQLIVAIHEKHRKGLPAEDPWFPGRFLEPPPASGPDEALLAHFWPRELRATLEAGIGMVNYDALWWSTLRGVVLGVLLVPGGLFLMIVGWKDLGEDLGASVSPIGLILLGIATLLIWFDCTRLCAAREVKRREVPRVEIVSRYNFLCRFTGATMLPWNQSSDARTLEISMPPTVL